MDYEQASKPILENIKLEKITIGKNIPLSDVKKWGRKKDDSLIDECDIYIKVLKTDCPKAIIDNNTLNIEEFGKSCHCKTSEDIWWLATASVYGALEFGLFSNPLQFVENTTQDFVLKCKIRATPKNKLITRCEHLCYRLVHDCTQCCEKDWKNINEEQWQKLHDSRAKLLNQVKVNEKSH